MMTDDEFIDGAIRTFIGPRALDVACDTAHIDDMYQVAAIARRRGVDPEVVAALRGYLVSPWGTWDPVRRLLPWTRRWSRAVHVALAVNFTLRRQIAAGL